MIQQILNNWRAAMVTHQRTNAFVVACSVACWKLQPHAKFSDMPDDIRYARVDEDVNRDELRAHLYAFGFDAKQAEEYSAEPTDQKRDRDEKLARKHISLETQGETVQQPAEEINEFVANIRRKIEERRKYQRDYAKKNKAKLRKQWRAYRERNRDKRNEQDRERYRKKMQARRSLYEIDTNIKTERLSNEG